MRRVPSITRSPARSTAPPISAASVSVCRRTSRFSLRCERLGERALLFFAERRGGGDRDVDHALFGILQLIEQLRDLGQARQAAVLRERLHEIAAVLIELRARDVR